MQCIQTCKGLATIATALGLRLNGRLPIPLLVNFLFNLQLHLFGRNVVQANLDMTDSMGPGKLVRHMQNPSYTYETYLICMGLGPRILSVICKNPSYSGPSYHLYLIQP